MSKIKTVVCDDSYPVAKGYEMYINYDDEMECCGICCSISECAKTIESTGADLLLLDIQMETETSGIDIVPSLKQQFPKLVIAMLTSFFEPNYIFHSLLNGADGYIVKSTNGEDALKEEKKTYYEVKAKRAGGGNDVIETFKEETKKLYENRKSMLYVVNNMVKLSASEYAILRDIYKGMTYRKIAEKRVVEECTINTIASRIIKKFEMENMKSIIKMLKEIRFFDEFSE